MTDATGAGPPLDGRKTLVGPRLRQLRRARRETQAEMARALGVSASYVNLLENNQRSLSVRMLLRLSETYGVDWRDLLEDDSATTLAELRTALSDPMFAEGAPDLQELRGALDHCPRLAQCFLKLRESFQTLFERSLALEAAQPGDVSSELLTTSPEAAAHDLFRRHRNHFDALERAAEAFHRPDISSEEHFGYLKAQLRERFDVGVRTVSLDDMPSTLRDYDEATREIHLSEALDYPNKRFQIAHVAGLLAYSETFDALIAEAGIDDARAEARCRVELANYFAAAVLMPYEPFLEAAQASRYDIDRIAAGFGVSFEQAAHRLTTLQREGAQGVPFFFLRVDKAGNVTKRFNATQFPLAEYGGACPRLDIHLTFRAPGRIMPQFCGDAGRRALLHHQPHRRPPGAGTARP